MTSILVKKVSVFLCVLKLFLSSPTSVAQEVYIRISENDCVNLHSSLFSALFKNPNEKNFKFLFPNNYQGKRFEQFNKLYFQNKVTLDKVVFSDTLYQLTAKPLNGFSGIAWIHNNKLLSTADIEYLVTNKLNLIDYVGSLNDGRSLVNLQEEGMSDRLGIATSYSSNKLALSDYIFRNIYYWDHLKNQTTIDLKDDGFQDMLKSKLSNKQYGAHLKYKDEVMKDHVAYPVPFGIELSESHLALSYSVPFTNLYNFAPKGEKEQLQPVPMQLFNIAVIPLNGEQITLEQLIDNSFTEKLSITIPEYYTTTAMGIYNHDIYRMNQLMYNKDDWSKKRFFPLLNKTKTITGNHSKDLVSTDIEGIENFSFQQDTLLNVNYLLDLQFNTVNENILMQNRPYAINIQTKKKYTLEWDSAINHYYYPPTITYQQLQFWETTTGFRVLVKKEDVYTLKTYDKEWQLQSENALPFNGKTINNLRFTQHSVYAFTNEDIYSLPNVFETRS